MLRGLRDLHAAGVVHGAVCPDNVAFDDDGVAHLSGFGTVAAGPGAPRGPGPPATAPYLPPESIGALEAAGGAGGRAPRWTGDTAAADVWAACATLCHAASGERPFAGMSWEQVSAAVLRKRPRGAGGVAHRVTTWFSTAGLPPRHPAVPPGLPPRLARAMSRAFEADPGARPSAAELLREARAGRDEEVACHVHGEAVPASEAVGCAPPAAGEGRPAGAAGPAREVHWACPECLENYVRSQEHSLGESFSGHLGDLPCRGLGTDCPGHLPRGRVAGVLRGRARTLFLRGVEAGARTSERREQHAAIHALREENERLRDQTRREREEEVARHINALAELQGDACPRCAVKFIDKVPGHCMALKCQNPHCQVLGVPTMFCGWCLADLGNSSDAAHAHVRRCARNPQPGQLFTEYAVFQRAMTARARDRTAEYLEQNVPGNMFQEIESRAAFILRPLGLGPVSGWARVSKRLMELVGVRERGVPRRGAGPGPGRRGHQGHWVNSNTFHTMSRPVGTCQMKSPRLIALRAMWADRAVSFPFCMLGTRAAAAAQRPTMAAPAKRWGPGNRRPVRM